MKNFRRVYRQDSISILSFYERVVEKEKEPSPTRVCTYLHDNNLLSGREKVEERKGGPLERVESLLPSLAKEPTKELIEQAWALKGHCFGDAEARRDGVPIMAKAEPKQVTKLCRRLPRS